MARTSLLLGVAICLLVAVPAAADTIDYTLTGNFGTVTFALPQFPTVTWWFSGFFFEIDGVSTSIGADNIVFRSTLLPGTGGLEDTAPPDVGLGVYSLTGPQLYTGGEAGPELLPGIFQVYDATGAPATVEAVLVPQVPEPASLLLLGTGLLGLGGRRRKRPA